MSIHQHCGEQEQPF